MQLSKHFSLAEMTFSDTGSRLGIKNEPPTDVVHNLTRLCEYVLEPMRDILGRPIVINSGYRSPELNLAIGGARKSQHMDGCAADLRVLGMTPYDVCRRIEVSQIPFDQLIHEFGRWTHISTPKLGEKPRRQLLTARLGSDGKTVYESGINPI